MNCYRIDMSGKILVGIPLLDKTGREPCVRIGHVTVPVRPNRATRRDPEVVGECLTEAQPAWHHGRPVLIARDQWEGVVLSVSVAELNFETLVPASFPVFDAWPGVETIEPAFVQVGRRRSHTQHQLVAIHHGTSAIIADRSRRYLTLSCKGGLLDVRPTRRRELAQHLIVRARERLSTHSSLSWTLKTVCALGSPDLWTRDLQARMHELRRGQGNRRVAAG